MTSPLFRTITSDDWKRELRAARERRKTAPERIAKQIKNYMSPEAQRIAIAEACGWRPYGEGKNPAFWFPPGSRSKELYQSHRLPDYLNDLNAMHEAVAGLSDADFHRYTLELGHISWRLFPHQIDDAQYKQRLRVFCNPTAVQSAEAFLRALNLWKTL